MALLGTYCGLKFAHAEDYILDPGDYTHPHQRMEFRFSERIEYILIDPRDQARRDYELRLRLLFEFDPYQVARAVTELPPREIYTRPLIVTPSFGDVFTIPTFEYIDYTGRQETGRPSPVEITPLFRSAREARGACLHTSIVGNDSHRGLRIVMGSSRR